jgi:hypothetical protein
VQRVEGFGPDLAELDGRRAPCRVPRVAQLPDQFVDLRFGRVGAVAGARLRRPGIICCDDARAARRRAQIIGSTPFSSGAKHYENRDRGQPGSVS